MELKILIPIVLFLTIVTGGSTVYLANKSSFWMFVLNVAATVLGLITLFSLYGNLVS